METLYQSLVTVNPVTLIAQICNLFIQLFLAKKFFLDKVKAILDQRREAADREITDAQTAKAEAMTKAGEIQVRVDFDKYVSLCSIIDACIPEEYPNAESFYCAYIAAQMKQAKIDLGY